MAKNTAHAIAIMLIVGAIICSFIAKFHCETTPKGSWTASYYVVSNIDDCVKKCRQKNRLKNRLIERKGCIKDCIVLECDRRHPIRTNYKWVACRDYLFALFINT
ncbi:hypothetical protein PIB30_118899 [Stylosanthes scabra]|uniref:Uncharacterized protein n=1 Tax=Stylosanthes scabra TaxID=79078 RepID=A0ABU6SN41_9FABA|nr:hypothetical protein [Stylosanthes scabra]